MASAALLLLAPVGVLIAITVAILSRRSLLVSHTRVGWRGARLRGAEVPNHVDGRRHTLEAAGN